MQEIYILLDNQPLNLMAAKQVAAMPVCGTSEIALN